MLSILIPNAEKEYNEELMSELERLYPAAEIVTAVDRERKGKGWAVREALESSSGDIVAFIDSDMDIAPRMLKRMIPFLEDYDIVIGSKKISNSPLHRKIITILSRIYIRTVFGLPFDTQTGIKIFKRDKLPCWEDDSFAFDIEILYKAKSSGYSIIEVPVESNITKSMSFKAVLNTFLHSLYIYIRSKLKGE